MFKSFLLLALCVVLSLATPMNIIIKLNNNATAGTPSRETIYVTNENPYLANGANAISDVRIGVSLIGIVPAGQSMNLAPEGTPVVGAIAAGSYAPFYFDTKGDAGLWMLKIVVSYKDETHKDRSKEKYFPYLVRSKNTVPSPRDVEDSDESTANDWVMKNQESFSSKQARGTCPAGSSNEIVSNDCNWSAVQDQKTFNTLGFYPNGVNITIVALNMSASSNCQSYKSDMSVGCNQPVPNGGGCGINFAVKCNLCQTSCATIYIYYKTSSTLGAPTKTWNSGCVTFPVGSAGTVCHNRRDVEKTEARAIESGRVKN